MNFTQDKLVYDKRIISHQTSIKLWFHEFIDLFITFERVTRGQMSNMMWNWHVMDSANYYWDMNILFDGELKICIGNFGLGLTKVGHEFFIAFCWFSPGSVGARVIC